MADNKKIAQAMQMRFDVMSQQMTNLFPATHFYTDSKLWFVNETFSGEGKCQTFMSADTRTQEVKPLFDHQVLAEQLSKRTKKEWKPDSLPMQILWVDEKGVSFRMPGQSVIWRFENGVLEMDALQADVEHTLSPDRSKIVMRCEHNLYVKDCESGEVTQLTFDGEKHNGYAERYEGDCDIIWDKLRGVPMPANVTFSDDSSRFITFKLDQSRLSNRYVVQHVPDENEPAGEVLYTFKWARPGDEHIAMQQLYISAPDGKSLIKLKVPPLGSNMFESIRGKAYCSAFTAEGDQIITYNMDRDYQKADVYVCDAQTGNARKIFTETSDTFLFFDFHQAFACTDQSYDSQGNTFFFASTKKDTLIWTAQRDGYYHICNYTLDGTLRNMVTSGAWNVRRIVRVDWETETVYFMGYGREPGANHRHEFFYSVRFDGSGLTLISKEKGHHVVNLSPDAKFFVDTVSDVFAPQKTRLMTIDGECLMELMHTEVRPQLQEKLVKPIEIEYEIDGLPVNGLLVLPEEAAKWQPGMPGLPLLEYNYGGPQMSLLPTQFTMMMFMGGYSQSLAQMGIAQIMIDAPGTPDRDKTYHDHCFRNIGEAAGLGYHVKFIRRLCEEYPMLDINRVGITGHSGGGYGTMAAMTRYAGFYKAGLASGLCHPIELYSDEWTRRFCGGYDAQLVAAQNCEPLLDKLQGKLMIIHGEMDDNVPLACAISVVDKLIKADKDFDFLIIPNRFHEIQSHPYYQRRLFQFFAENL